MKILNKKFKGLILIKNKSFKDNRGYFREIIRENKINKRFPFQVMSFSKKNVLRGIHIQNNKSQGKFITVIKGKIFDVAVDLRFKSKTFGKHFSCILSHDDSSSIYIPPGFGHGFQALSDENYVVYSCTHYRDKFSEKSVNPNDVSLKIKWPLKKKILSEKDKNAMTIKEYKEILKKTRKW
ncbi:dTDP-4-dehydrorhamnose 3,5-epimerase [Candidatus Pelagibacter sp.]|uniref:dTDP-4-dehydrorhamnose 3,5-epimerase n=1 Tax=Candidatus Pelagibacter sp. TaxID=2024849 RepID=UPI003F87EC77